MNKINLQFSIEEIILIKDGLKEICKKAEKRLSQQTGKSNCYDLLTEKQITTVNDLLERLSPYGYGM